MVQNIFKHIIYTIAVLLLGSYPALKAQGLQLHVKHIVGQQALILNQETKGGIDNSVVNVELLKYYLSDITFHLRSGKTISDPIRFHLINFQNNPQLFIGKMELPVEPITAISFGIGVDSLTNDKGLMDGDLDPMHGMYWAWNSGFINFKLEGHLEKGKAKKEFAYHIGGFQAPNQTYQMVKIPISWDPSNGNNTLVLQVDLAELLKNKLLQSEVKILSPSAKAKAFSELLPLMFSIAP